MGKTASGQVGPKNERNRPPGKRVKRGRLHFTEEEVTRQAGEPTSGQVGPKPAGGGKFRQDEEREKPSSRLRQDDDARSRDTAHEEQDAQKARKDKQEKKKERGRGQGRTLRCQAGSRQGKAGPAETSEAARPPQRAATAAGQVYAATPTAKYMRSSMRMGVESAQGRASGRGRGIRPPATPSGVSGSTLPGRWRNGNTRP